MKINIPNVKYCIKNDVLKNQKEGSKLTKKRGCIKQPHNSNMSCVLYCAV